MDRRPAAHWTVGLLGCLAGIGPLHASEPAARLVVRLCDRDYEVREEATRSLVALGIDAVPACLELSNAAHPEQLRRVRHVLGRILADTDSTAASIERLERILASSDPETSCAARRFRAELRIKGLIAEIGPTTPDDDASLMALARRNAQQGFLETAIAHVRLLGLTRPSNGLVADAVVQERELWDLMHSKGYPTDPLERRRRRQLVLESSLQLLNADVPDEAERLAKGIDSGDSVPVLHGDSDLHFVLFCAELACRESASLGGKSITPNTKTGAGLVLTEARRQLREGNVAAARGLGELVASWDVTYGLFDDRPELLLADVNRRESVGRGDGE